MTLSSRILHFWRSLEPRWQRALVVTVLVAVTASLAGAVATLLLGKVQFDWNRPLFMWAPVPAVPKLVMLATYGGLLAVGMALIAFLIRRAATVDEIVPALSGAARLASRRILQTTPAQAYILVLIASLPLVWALAVKPFQVPNEFLALTSQTIGTDGVVRDNLDFIRRTGLEGMEIPLADSAAAFLRIRLRPEARASARTLAIELPELYWFDARRNEFEIQRIDNVVQYQALLALATPADLPALRKRFVADLLSGLEFAGRRYTEEEKEFLRSNRPELERALVLGRFFYHHNFIFSAAVAQAVDPATVTGSQYGKGLTQAFAAVLRMTPEPWRFNAYLLLLYAGYPLYLALVYVCARGCGLRRWPLALVTACTVLSYLMSEIETVRLGVGLAPWRHFLDIAVIYAVFRVVSKRRWQDCLLLLALVSAGIYWSREMGLFIGLAAAGALGITALVQKDRRSLVLVFLLLVAQVAIWKISNPHAQTLMVATLLGVNTPGLPWGFVWATAASIGAMLACWFWLLRALDIPKAKGKLLAEWVVVGTVVLYAAASAVYLMYYPRPHHLAPYFPALSVGALLGFDLMLRARGGQRAVILLRRATPALIAAVVACTLFLGVLRATEAFLEHRIFAKHVMHDWRMPAAQLQSTASPRLLEQSVALIRSRSKQAEVDVLSPWDVVLLPLAGRGKNGPFVVSFDSLLTEVEVIRLADHLVLNGGDVIFVDTRLVEGRYELPLLEQAYMKDRVRASVLRLRAHAGLRHVFARIEPCFELVEKGPLISAYRRVSRQCASK